MIENIDDLVIMGYRVLVKVEVVKKVGSIELPDEVAEKETDKIGEGILLDAGEKAFEQMIENISEAPAFGDRVYFVKYAGKAVRDINGQEYRVINDEDIYAFVRSKDE